MFVCLFVCLYPINFKTAEPIGLKFFVWPHVTPGRVYEEEEIVLKKIFVFENFDARKNIMKSANFSLYTVQREDAHR